MKKIVLSSLFIFSFCNILFPGDSSQKKNYVAATAQYVYKNPMQTLGSLVIGGSTLYGAHQLGAERLVWQIGKGLTHYEYYPTALVALAGSYWYKWWSHYKKLDEIDRKLSDSTINKNELYWSVWKLDQWKTAREVKFNSKSVTDELKLEIKDKESKKEKISQIQREKEQLQEWIRYAGAFTRFSGEFVKKVESTKPIEYASSILDPANAANKAICAAQHLKELNIPLDEDEKNSSLLAQKNGNSYFYAHTWFNPFTWTLAPWPEKAQILCAKLIRLYGRLCALEDSVKNFQIELSKVDQLKELSKTPNVKVTGGILDVFEKKK